MKTILKCSVALITVILVCVAIVFAEEIKKWQTTGNVTLRAEPGLEGEVVSYIKQGVVLDELAESGRWIKVKTPSGKVGWVHKSLLIPVSQQNLSPCEGVQGFSALCPLNKEEKQKPQGKEVSTTQKVNPLMQKTIKGDTTPEETPIPITTIDSQKLSQVVPPQQQNERVEGKTVNQNISVPPSKLISSGNVLLEESDIPVGGFKTSYIVEPETTTAVKMSASDVNRIVCPVDIRDVVYSEEKGLQIKIAGKNAFIKFLIKRIGTKEEYSKIPADIYVVCGDRVYSIIAFPQRQPATTVYLQDKGHKVKEMVDKYASMPLEKKIIELVKAFSKDTPPLEAEFHPVRKEHKLYEGLKILEKGRYVILGEGLQVKVIDITVTELPANTKYVEIAEKDFLRAEITRTPLALSLDKLRLYKGDTARLLIIEKNREED